jgi:hypothetical protein
MTSAYSLLVSYRTPTSSIPQRRFQPTFSPDSPSFSATVQSAPLSSGMTFAQQQTSPVPGSDGVLHPTITCYQCHGSGHYANTCPVPVLSTAKSASPGTTLMQYVLAQSTADGIHPRCVLLDSQSTISVFMNPSMLTNIRTSPHPLRAITNGGHQDSHMIGDFPVLGPVWFNPASIANILSFSAVRKCCRVTMDTHAAPCMTVHRTHGSLMHFLEQPSGLYIFDPNFSPAPAVTLFSTVSGNKSAYSPRDVASADTARLVYRLLGRPSESDFQHILRHNLLHNCPITPQDASRALRIYGPDLASLKGKTTKTSAAPRTPTFVDHAPLLEYF